MTGRDTKSDAETIGEIIEAEQEKALARFRSGRFGDRLKKRLAERPTAHPFPARARPVQRPVWVSLAALAAIAMTALWLIRPWTPAPKAGAVVEAFLHGLPGLQAIENPLLPLSAVSPAPGSQFEKNIAAVLSVPPAVSISPGRGRAREFPAIKPGSEPLGLERVYEILIIDRSVERVLADIRLKTKEG